MANLVTTYAKIVDTSLQKVQMRGRSCRTITSAHRVVLLNLDLRRCPKDQRKGRKWRLRRAGSDHGRKNKWTLDDVLCQVKPTFLIKLLHLEIRLSGG